MVNACSACHWRPTRQSSTMVDCMPNVQCSGILSKLARNFTRKWDALQLTRLMRSLLALLLVTDSVSGSGSRSFRSSRRPSRGGSLVLAFCTQARLEGHVSRFPGVQRSRLGEPDHTTSQITASHQPHGETQWHVGGHVFSTTRFGL